MKLYSSIEAAELAGISYRQLDSWTRLGILVPFVEADGQGSRRRWTAEGILQARAIGKLTSFGVPLTEFQGRSISEVIARFRAELVELESQLNQLEFLVRRERTDCGSGNPFGEVRGRGSELASLLALV